MVSTGGSNPLGLGSNPSRETILNILKIKEKKILKQTDKRNKAEQILYNWAVNQIKKEYKTVLNLVRRTYEHSKNFDMLNTQEFLDWQDELNKISVK